MRTSKIKGIAKKIDKEINPENMVFLINNRVKKFRIFFGRRALLSDGYVNCFKKDIKPWPCGFVVGVSLVINPWERLSAFFHEIFHIVYLDKEVPSFEEMILGWGQRQILEDLVEASAQRFISKYPQFCEILFEQKIGIRHTDFWEE